MLCYIGDIAHHRMRKHCCDHSPPCNAICVLIPLLDQVFYDATQFFSREGKDAPSLTDVIPAMDLIDEQLATSALDPALDPAIRVAVSLGKRSINHYYNKSDESAAYRIAMGAYH